MNIGQIIEILKTMPQDQKLWHIWDGAPRTSIQHIWISRSGKIITADGSQMVHDKEYWPKDTSVNQRFWETPRTDEVEDED